MRDISVNIKKVLLVFLICFIALISYLAYFEMIDAPKLVLSPYNSRLWAKRNEVLRGTIYDRNMTVLSKSERTSGDIQKREYDGGSMFAHALGYVDPKYGLTGLERKYDTDLMGASDQSLLEWIKAKGKVDKKIGRSIQTTLDFQLQKLSFELLGNNRGAVVALEPRTGEILALVSTPSFDPNYLKENWKAILDDKSRPLLNRAVSGLYPPGSTFKTITAVSALENIKEITNRRFQDDGRLVFNAKESLSNFGGEVLGNLSFKDAYVHSSNVVFGTLGMELGNTKLKETAEKFFFNKNTPADGIIIDDSQFPTFKKYEKGNIAQSAIGQSAVLATPMQMALVASTIANDGIMMEPRLVDKILSSSGETMKKIDDKAIGVVTSKQNALVMKTFMRGVVSDGTGVGANIAGLDVCGKTGTADHNDGNKSAPHSWFIGFAPYNDPQIAVAVLVEEGGQGGKTAAGIASKVIQAALKK